MYSVLNMKYNIYYKGAYGAYPVLTEQLFVKLNIHKMEDSLVTKFSTIKIIAQWNVATDRKCKRLLQLTK